MSEGNDGEEVSRKSLTVSGRREEVVHIGFETIS